MSTAGVFSRSISSPLGCDAGAIEGGGALEPRVQKLSWLLGLLLWGAFAVGFIVHESRSLPLRGATRATVLTVDGPSGSSYRYRYVVGDRVCRGEASSDKPSIVVDATDWFKGTTCQETSLQGDTRNYRLFNDAQQPPVPRDRPGAGEHVTLWFDPDIDWANVSQTRVLALSLAEEPTDRPDHRPGCAWERFSGRRPRDLLEEVP